MKSTTTYFICIALILVFAPLSLFCQSIPENLPIRINAGGPALNFNEVSFEAGDGSKYQTNGHVYAPNLNGTPISNTDWDELYKTELFHEQLTYRIPVIDETCYQVRLHFAEIYFNSPGGAPEPEWGRIFDVIVEGEMKIDDYNIIKAEGSSLKAAVYTYEVCVGAGDNEILLEFPARSNHAKISAIEILRDCGDNCPEVGATFPIELIDFDVRQQEDAVALSWTTAWETNNARFEIERSTDAKHFSPIYSLSGAGNSQEPITYRAIDTQPLQGRTYYRLKQIDFDGKFAYSSIVDIEVHLQAQSFNIYPNPLNKTATVNFELTGFNPNQPLNVSIRDLNGKILFHQKSIADASGSVYQQLHETQNLASGLYLVSVDDGLKMETKSLVIR